VHAVEDHNPYPAQAPPAATLETEARSGAVLKLSQAHRRVPADDAHHPNASGDGPGSLRKVRGSHQGPAGGAPSLPRALRGVWVEVVVHDRARAVGHRAGGQAQGQPRRLPGAGHLGAARGLWNDKPMWTCHTCGHETDSTAAQAKRRQRIEMLIAAVAAERLKTKLGKWKMPSGSRYRLHGRWVWVDPDPGAS
jgi:hypothetical protein